MGMRLRHIIGWIAVHLHVLLAVVPTIALSVSSLITTTTSRMSSSLEPTTTGIAAKLARPNILELQPYRCARDDYSSGLALLDANENAYGSPLSTTTSSTITSGIELHRYPDPHQTELKIKVGTYRRGVPVDHIFVGVGSDEAIDLLIRIFCVPGQDCIMTTPPTYGMYKVCAKINNVDVVSVPLTPDFDLQVDQVRVFLPLYDPMPTHVCCWFGTLAYFLSPNQIANETSSFLSFHSRFIITILYPHKTHQDDCHRPR
jgi:Aminotransferase class I and II